MSTPLLPAKELLRCRAGRHRTDCKGREDARHVKAVRQRCTVRGHVYGCQGVDDVRHAKLSPERQAAIRAADSTEKHAARQRRYRARKRETVTQVDKKVSAVDGPQNVTLSEHESEGLYAKRAASGEPPSLTGQGIAIADQGGLWRAYRPVVVSVGRRGRRRPLRIQRDWFGPAYRDPKEAIDATRAAVFSRRRVVDPALGASGGSAEAGSSSGGLTSLVAR